MHYTRSGRGKPLLLVHGLGATSGSWDTIAPALSQDREVIAIDLPGHGQTPEEADSGTFDGLARSLDEWLGAENLTGIDMVGSSLGARLVLEMARRGCRARPGRLLAGVGAHLLQSHLDAVGGSGSRAATGTFRHHR